MVQDYLLLLFLMLTTAVLVWIAYDDICRFKILNIFSLVIAALYIPVFLLSGDISFAKLGVHLATAAVALVLGFTLFLAGVLGGGDAKLLSAVALWAGRDDILLVLAVSSLVGGVMAFVYLGIEIVKRRRLRRQKNAVSGLDGAAVAAAGSDGTQSMPGESVKTLPRLRMTKIPYGVAIGSGHLVLIYTLAMPAIENILGA